MSSGESGVIMGCTAMCTHSLLEGASVLGSCDPSDHGCPTSWHEGNKKNILERAYSAEVGLQKCRACMEHNIWEHAPCDPGAKPRVF